MCVCVGFFDAENVTHKAAWRGQSDCAEAELEAHKQKWDNMSQFAYVTFCCDNLQRLCIILFFLCNDVVVVKGWVAAVLSFIDLCSVGCNDAL